jgi:hypothetical protein
MTGHEGDVRGCESGEQENKERVKGLVSLRGEKRERHDRELQHNYVCVSPCPVKGKVTITYSGMMASQWRLPSMILPARPVGGMCIVRSIWI